MGNLIAPSPGVVYKFLYEPGYNAYDGVYRLVKLMTYDEYLEDGGNILADFFVPNHKTEEDLNLELEAIRSSKIMKLVSPEDTDETTVIYAPLCYIRDVPDCNVKEYQSFGVVAYVGITDDLTQLDYVKGNIVEQFESALGISSNPQFVITKTVWLTDAEYQDELVRREATKKAVINYFSENKRLQKQLSQQKTLIAEYERLIISLTRQVETLSSGG